MCSKDIMERGELPTLSNGKTNEAESLSRESARGDASAESGPINKSHNSCKQHMKNKKKSSDQKSGEDQIFRGSRHRSEHTTKRDCDVAEDQGDTDKSKASSDRNYKRSVTGVSQKFDHLSLGTSWSQPYTASRSSGMSHQDCAVSTSFSDGMQRSCMSLRELPTNPEALPDVKNHFIFSDSDVRSRVDLNGSDSGSSSGRSRQGGTENYHKVTHERESEATHGTKDFRGGGGQVPSSSGSSSNSNSNTPWIGAPGGRVNGIPAGSGNGNRGAGRLKLDPRRSKPPPGVEGGRNGNHNRDNDGGCGKNFDTKSNGHVAAVVSGHTKSTERIVGNHNSSGVLVHGFNGTSFCEGRCSPDVANQNMTQENIESRQGVREPSADDSITEQQSHFVSESRNPPLACPRGGEAADPRGTVVDVFARQVEAKGPIKGSTQDFDSKTSQEVIANAREYYLPAAKARPNLHGFSDNRDRISSGSSSSTSSSSSYSSRNTYGSRRPEEHLAQPNVSNSIARRGHKTQEIQNQNVGVLASRQPGNPHADLDEVADEGSASTLFSSDQKSKAAVIEDLVREAGSAGPVAYKRIQLDYRNGEGKEAEQQPGSLTTGLNTRAPFEGSANGIVTENRRSRTNFEDIDYPGGYDGAVEDVSTATSVKVPSRSLRRLKSFPSGNANAFARGLGSEAGAQSSARPDVAAERKQHSSNYEPAANLRGLLPKARTVVSSANSQQNSDESSKSLPGDGEQQARVGIGSDKGPSGNSGQRLNLRQPSTVVQETCRVTGPDVDAIRISCEGRRMAYDIARDVGYPMAEFERVLEAVAPGFCCPPVGDTCHLARATETPRGIERKSCLRSVSCSRFPQYGIEDGFATCRCNVADVPLSSMWQWYEEPSFYGAAVKSFDDRKAPKDEVDELPFAAYFVPYLSAIQIFGYSRDVGMSVSDGSVGGKQKMSPGSSSHSQNSSVSDMLATLFPSPGRSDGESSPSPSHLKSAACPAVGQVDGNDANDVYLGSRLLYEFSDSEPPQMRQPLFTKVEELSKGPFVSKSHSNGDPQCLEGLRLRDVHPASWFAVAWYPIYRIPEGSLRTVFLTYHSFNHFARRRTMITQTEGPTHEDDVFLPVVGLECYSFQLEMWLSMGGRFSMEATKMGRTPPVNFKEFLQNRLASLRAVAAVMGKGVPSDNPGPVPTVGTGSKTFSHSDYEFFVKRRR